MSDDMEDPSFGYTNGFKVFFNPRLYILSEQQNKQQNRPWFRTIELGLVFTILHEIGHIVFDSFGRRSLRSPRMWNWATDYQINQFVAKLMKEAGVFRDESSYKELLNVLLKNFLLDPARYEKLTAEQTFDDLYKASISSDKHDPGAGKGLEGDMQEPEDDDLSDQEKMTRSIVQSEMQNYVGKNAGKLPGNGTGFREFEFLQEPPKVNLRQILKSVTERDFTKDWGYSSRGSRMDHMMPNGIRLPEIVDMNPDLVKNAFFVLDSSGSMTSEQQNDAINIVKELLEKYTRTPVWLIIHTSEICYSGPITDFKDALSQWSGGTAFWPIIFELKRIKKEERIEPSVVLWLNCWPLK